MNWMVWTLPTGIFFACIALMLITMTILEIRLPNVPRRGLLPVVTTRGDRLFIGLLTAAYVNLAWIGLTELDQWWGASLGFLALAAVMRWG
jgi:predicted small integral membrane protein